MTFTLIDVVALPAFRDIFAHEYLAIVSLRRCCKGMRDVIDVWGSIEPRDIKLVPNAVGVCNMDIGRVELLDWVFRYVPHANDCTLRRLIDKWPYELWQYIKLNNNILFLSRDMVTTVLNVILGQADTSITCPYSIGADIIEILFLNVKETILVRHWSNLAKFSHTINGLKNYNLYYIMQITHLDSDKYFNIWCLEGFPISIRAKVLQRIYEDRKPIFNFQQMTRWLNQENNPDLCGIPISYYRC